MNLYFDIIHWLEKHQLPCIIKKITHFDCPGCGLQRSCIALLKGNAVESFKMYPALIPMLLFFILLKINTKYMFVNPESLNKIGIASIFSIILLQYIIKLTT